MAGEDTMNKFKAGDLVKVNGKYMGLVLGTVEGTRFWKVQMLDGRKEHFWGHMLTKVSK
jgi:hypothetical protein